MLKSIPSIRITGPVGGLDTLIFAVDNPVGIAIVAHPNPLQGGTNTNKVVHTLAKALNKQGVIAFCPNLRGVGGSEGIHDHGVGEVEDILAVLAYAQAQHPELPIILAGFSFGGFVQTFVANHLHAQGQQVQHLILVGLAAGRYNIALPAVPADSPVMLIHGEEDEVIPLQAVVDWARPQKLPVMVIPGVGHFFHGHLPLLANTVGRLWSC